MFTPGDQRILAYLWTEKFYSEELYKKMVGKAESKEMLKLHDQFGPISWSVPMVNLRDDMKFLGAYKGKRFHASIKKLRQMGLIVVHGTPPWLIGIKDKGINKLIMQQRKTFFKEFLKSPYLNKEDRKDFKNKLLDENGRRELLLRGFINTAKQKYVYMTPDGQFLMNILKREYEGNNKSEPLFRF